MKRILSITLAIMMLLGLCACGGQETGTTEPMAAAFSVGYAKTDISPRESVPMGGYSNAKDRWSTQVADPLELICIAFSDTEGNTVLYFVADLLMAYDHVSEALRDAVSEKTGVPKDHIMYQVTHNHSGPETNMTSAAAIVKYINMHTESAVQIAQEALADRKPAQMHTAFSRPEGINTVRHYLLADGTYKGEGVGSVPKTDIIGHTDAPDNLLQVVKFTREGGKDVVLINWQGHPNGYEPNSETSISATCAGATRREVEAALDCLPVYILGGSGNMNNNSQLADEVKYHNYLELGKGLAREVAAALENAKPAATGTICLAENILQLTNNQGELKDLPLYAFSIGEVAFVTAPAEIFFQNAVAVKETSKFPMTLYASCANGYNGYLPTPKPFDYYAYEVRITKYPMGTAETLQEEQIKLLDTIFAESGNAETEKPEGYLTPEFTPVSDGVEYINLVPGDLSAAKEVANGYYALFLMEGTDIRNMLAIDKQTAELVLSKPTMKLLFNAQNVIVGVAE